MEIGIFATTFLNEHGPAPDLGTILDQVSALGVRVIHFDTLCVGLSSMPEAIKPAEVARVRSECTLRNLKVSSLSAYFNMAHPDPTERESGLRQLRVLAANAHGFGTNLLTLCTGTRSRESMWSYHSNSNTNDAWADMRSTMLKAIEIAEKHDLYLGIEPEVANVVSSPRKARQLLDEMNSKRLKIVMDGANIFPNGTLPCQREILDEAFDLLGSDIGLVHAKDLTKDGAAGDVAAGTGLLDFNHYIKLLRDYAYNGPVVLHGLSATQAEGCVAFLKSFD